jgi:lipopolysaccharide assembly protein B
MEPLLWLLLPVAALSGWLIGRGGTQWRHSRGGQRPDDHRPQYFRGLNYLLNEQPDKAIEVFVRMAEIDADTAETHLALGSLFRRRGEVERAIRVHQNLIARPSLSREQRVLALLALGEDYLRAGLLDRAESLFRETVDAGLHVERALAHLLDLYQQEKEWAQAIDVALRLEQANHRRPGGKPMGPLIAQLRCELAQQAQAPGQTGPARQLLRQALRADPKCVRASILEGRWAMDAGQPAQALKAYQQVRHQDVDYLPEVLEPMLACYRALGREGEFEEYLRSVQYEYNGVSLLLMLAEQVRARQGDAAAITFLTTQLERRPSVRGLNRLLELMLETRPSSAGDGIEVLSGLFAELLRSNPGYVCGECGFTGRQLHWQCPGCRSWGTIKPIHGVEGE